MHMVKFETPKFSSDRTQPKGDSPENCGHVHPAVSKFSTVNPHCSSGYIRTEGASINHSKAGVIEEKSMDPCLSERIIGAMGEIGSYRNQLSCDQKLSSITNSSRSYANENLNYELRKPIIVGGLQRNSKLQGIIRVNSRSTLEPHSASDSKKYQSDQVTTGSYSELILKNNISLPYQGPEQNYFEIEKSQSAPGRNMHSDINQSLFSAWKMIDEFKRQFAYEEALLGKLTSTRVDKPQQLNHRLMRSSSNKTLIQEIPTAGKMIRSSSSATKLPTINAENRRTETSVPISKSKLISTVAKKIPFLENSNAKNDYACHSARAMITGNHCENKTVVQPSSNDLSMTFRTPLKDNTNPQKDLNVKSKQKEDLEFSFNQEIEEENNRFQVELKTGLVDA